MSVIYPLVWRGAEEFELTCEHLDELEQAGGIKFAAAERRRLRDLAHLWALGHSGRESARPRQFRLKMEAIRKALLRAHCALDLHRAAATAGEHHLLNWLPNSGVKGARTFFKDQHKLLAQMQSIADFMARAQGALPVDRGAPRSWEDELFFARLADIFEAAGGKASAWRSEHAASGIGETPFRRFAHAFYRVLPLRPRRTLRGVDEALISALRARRGPQKKGSQAAKKIRA